jgi:hypothetical protein
MSDIDKARLILTDEPYNVPVAGYEKAGSPRVLDGKWRDDRGRFASFNTAWIVLPWSPATAVRLPLIDWRSYPVVVAAALARSHPFSHRSPRPMLRAPLSLPARALPLFKKAMRRTLIMSGAARMVAGDQCLEYPGAYGLGCEARKRRKYHFTVKPVAMLEDALLDMTERDIVIDPFLGSGSTLIACERPADAAAVSSSITLRRVILCRYETVTKQPAVLQRTGETLVELAVRRQCRPVGTAIAKLLPLCGAPFCNVRMHDRENRLKRCDVSNCLQ